MELDFEFIPFLFMTLPILLLLAIVTIFFLLGKISNQIITHKQELEREHGDNKSDMHDDNTSISATETDLNYMKSVTKDSQKYANIFVPKTKPAKKEAK